MTRTSIHYICISQSCLADLMAEERTDTVTCSQCGKTWTPANFQEGSWARGKEESYESA